MAFALLVAVSAPARAEDAPTKFEGAIGLVSSYSPEYAGAGAHTWHFVPAGFVRYGRITISGAGGFRTRSDHDVERGVAASLVQRDRFRLSVGLRFDRGRSESNSDRLAGMGDVDSTVRTRIIAHWKPDARWTLSTSVSIDALGQGGGWWGDFGVSRTWQVTPQTKFSLSGSLTYAGDTYFQTWYGVTEAQAAKTGYPVYRPGEGVRDVTLGVSLRSELGPHWAGFVSAGASRQMGPTLDSPLVDRPFGWGLGGGLVWRF